MHPNVKALIEGSMLHKNRRNGLPFVETCSQHLMQPQPLVKTNTKHLINFFSKNVVSVKNLRGMRLLATESFMKTKPVSCMNSVTTKLFMRSVLFHPVHKWLGGSPDGVSESGKLVEIKCPPQRAIIPGEVPEHYMPQLQLCMEILDLESADFIQYKPAATNWPKPEEFDVVNVPRDREWFKTYLPVMKEFWDKVLYFREHKDELPAPKLKKTRRKNNQLNHLLDRTKPRRRLFQ